MWRQDDLFALLNRTAEVRYPEAGDITAVPAALRRSPHPPPRSIPCPPLMHGSGAFTTFSVLNSGGCIVLLEGRHFSAVELLDTVQRERATQLTIVGDAFARPLLAELDAHPGRWDISSLWLIVSSGVMWAEETKAGLLRHHPGLLCVDALGSSEAIGIASSRSSARSTAATGGFTLGPDARVITDDGQDVAPGSGQLGLVALRGRGPIGYYKDEAKTAATFRVIDGVRWSVPGDWALVNADGTVRLLGRGSQSINTGGEKVFPEEVEEALKTYPAVLDAVALGVPDERFGEVVTALVEVSGPIDEDIVIAHVKSRLASFKAPRHVIVVPSIGRDTNGKVDYRRLRAELAERAGRP
jgi:acyl-CoA synthetase (AMP-forming)/AMP-acid ligase II